jgi:hypothetical protein
LTPDQEIVNFGDGVFVADRKALPLLRALNGAGLKTRTHHFDGDHGFVGILMENVRIEVRPVNEIHADREKYNGKQELLIQWDNTKEKEPES